MEPIPLQIKYNGQVLVVRSLFSNNTIGDLKSELYKMTKVLPETQMVLGLRRINNLPVDDSVPLSELILKPNTKLMLIGSTEEDIKNVNTVVESVPEVVDDFEFKEEDVHTCFLPENIEKVSRRAKAYRARKLCDPRPGKHLLVLDVDYTIFDHLTPAESARQLARPYLYEFLSRAYVYYDIAIWSATSLTWILAKLGQLGVIPANAAAILRQNASGSASASASRPTTADSATGSSPDQTQQTDSSAQQPQPHHSNDLPNSRESFRVSLLLDSSDMISVYFPTHGVKEVKPLAVIWENHPQWGSHNTIMFDDVRRNFIMNPQNGLRIRSYRDAHTNYKTDRELRGLARYLELIAQNEPDFTKLNHNHWDRYIAKCKRIKRHMASPSALTVDRLPQEADKTPARDNGSEVPNSIPSSSSDCLDHSADTATGVDAAHESGTPTPGAVDAPGDTTSSR